MDPFDAIYFRTSVRKYLETPLPSDVIASVCQLLEDVELLYKKLPVRVYFVEQGECIQHLQKGPLGTYYQVKAPHYLVVTSEEKEGCYENVGYAVEHIVLALTTMGIGTCWVGGMINKRRMQQVVSMKKDHVPMMTIALGTPLHPEELSTHRMGARKRREIKEFVEGPMDKTLHQVMDAVRLAPSSLNSQPWRFYIDDSRIDVYAKVKQILGIKPLTALNRIDTGIALCHYSIAARHFGLPFVIKQEAGHERNGLLYITSIQRHSQ